MGPPCPKHASARSGNSIWKRADQGQTTQMSEITRPKSVSVFLKLRLYGKGYRSISLPSFQSVSQVGDYFFLNEVEVNRESRRARSLDCPTMRRDFTIHNDPNLDFVSQVEDSHDRPNSSRRREDSQNISAFQKYLSPVSLFL